MSTRNHQVGQMVEKAAMTRLLVDYLYTLFPDYEEFKDKPWTRESDLDYALANFGGSLREILTDPDTLRAGQKNIIVFRGDREGDGKEFYLHKLIETCYEVIPHFVWEDFKKIRQDKLQFRFPVIMDRDSLQLALNREKIDLAELAELCFVTQLGLEIPEQKAAAKELAKYLATNGMLAIFVGAGICEDPLSLIATRLTPLPESVTSLPILIIFADRSFATELSEGDDFCCVDIPPLSDHQILRYIAIEVPDCSQLLTRIKKNPQTIDILRKQERLLKQVQIWKKRLPNNLSHDISFLEVETNYIDDMLQGGTALRGRLYEAAECELCGKAIPSDVLEAMGNTDFFNCDGHFTYAECKYFLVAEKCYDESPLKRRFSDSQLQRALEGILEQWPVEVEYYFAEFLLHKRGGKDRDNLFLKYWKTLCAVLEIPKIRNLHVPANVLVGTMCFTNQVRSSYQAYVKWAVEALKSDTYDEKVLEGLSNLSRDDNADIDDLVQKALLDEYQNAETMEIRRRIVYFYSRAGYPIPNEIVQDLEDTTKDRHLRYHIVSALIETLDAEGADAMDYYEDGQHYRWVGSGVGNDAILQSEFETLYFRKTGQLHPEGTCLSTSIDSLMDKLRSGEYWEKAHAAGALCRLARLNNDSIRQIISGFEDILRKELDALRTGREPNRLKTVSYIMEAMCKLLYRATPDERVRLSLRARKKIASVLGDYMQPLLAPQTAQEVYNSLNSAQLLLVCGLICMDNQQLPLRKLLGEQFSPGSRFESLLKVSGVGDPAELVPDDGEGNLPDLLEQWIERQKNAELPCPNFEPIVSAKYDISVGQIYAGEQRLGMGFLIRWDSTSQPFVYCVTCRHLFDSIEGTLPPVTIQTLAPKDRAPRYELEPICPPEFSERLTEAATENAAQEDITIWRAYGVSCDLSPHIFCVSDLAGPDERKKVKREATPLHSYGFPKEGIFPVDKISGRELDYRYMQNQGDYCTLRCENLPKILEQRGDDLFVGYSGAPIVDEADRIYAMHKGNMGYEEIIGITLETVKKFFR